MGPETEIPYFLLPQKEDKNIVKIIVDKLEQELIECKQPLQITILGKSINITSEIKHSQFDRSLIEKVSGLGGAICTMVINCFSKMTSVNSLEFL